LLALQKAFHARADVALRLSPGEREPEYAPPFNQDGTQGPGAKEGVADAGFSLAAIKARAAGRQLTEAELAQMKKPSGDPGDATENPAPRKKNGMNSKVEAPEGLC
jgi:hypothetical protein